jgi:hypothetical protein
MRNRYKLSSAPEEIRGKPAMYIYRIYQNMPLCRTTGNTIVHKNKNMADNAHEKQIQIIEQVHKAQPLPDCYLQWIARI